MSQSVATPLIVYGASWCPDCRRAKEFLSAHRAAYEWVDLEAHPEQVVQVESRNAGKRIIPTIVFPDGSFLVEPSNDELAEKLGLVRDPQSSAYDLVIMGGGPTGLTTAIYGARENLSVLIVERSAPGGQAAVTERLDNYPGFPDGVSGAELAGRMTEQARRYGVEILQAVAVTGIEVSEGGVTVDLSTGRQVSARALLLASGSTYRRTGAHGESGLIGAGIHFCATCDGPFYRGAVELTVIGGGNSGLEEGLFLTQFAEHVTVVQAGPELTASRLLQDKVLDHPRMSVLLDTSVASFNADGAGKLTSLSLVRGVEEFEHATSGAFIFIGLDPNSRVVADVVELDERGFILTDERLSTSMPGVFAAGDVRAGSTKQIASAVGEGAAVALQLRYYLDAQLDAAL